jgi:hypothetical protein
MNCHGRVVECLKLTRAVSLLKSNSGSTTKHIEVTKIVKIYYYTILIMYKSFHEFVYEREEKVPASTTGTSKYLLILDMYCNKVDSKKMVITQD